MARLNHMILGLLILQLYVNAAPSEVSSPEDIKEIDQTEPKLETNPKEFGDDTLPQTIRQKRWFDDYQGFGIPPYSSVIYSSYNKRDDTSNTAVFGEEDPFSQIYKRIQDIANIVRHPPPPPPPQIPIFYPVLYIPIAGCGCNDSPATPNVPPTDKESTDKYEPTDMPDVTERQNFKNDTGDQEEFTRPISFVPIQPNRPLSRPPPPVEHGSVQGESGNEQTTNLNDVIPIAQSPPTSEEAPTIPSACDSAVISCCHQAQIAYSCFAAQGCPDFTAYSGGRGKPCDSNIILRAVERFQRFYNQKLG